MSSTQAHRARAPPVHGRQAQIFTPEMRLTLRRISSPYKEANTIDDFKAVRSSLDISRSLKYYLSMRDHDKYGDSTKIVRALNDTLQGRGERTVEQLLAEMDAVCGGWKDYDEDRAMLRQRIQAFSNRKPFYPKSTIKPATVNIPMKRAVEEKSLTKIFTTKLRGMAFRLAFFIIPFSTG